MEADILTFTEILTPEDASVASCSPLWYHDQPKLVPSPQYTSPTLRYTIGTGNFQLVPGRHFSNPENINISWRLPNLYPESYDWGLPDHGPVDWPHGLTSLDRPRGLAGGRRSGHELLPRINKQKRLNMRRSRTWWNDKTLQLVQMMGWCRLGQDDIVYCRIMCHWSWWVNRCNPMRHMA